LSEFGTLADNLVKDAISLAGGGDGGNLTIGQQGPQQIFDGLTVQRLDQKVTAAGLNGMDRRLGSQVEQAGGFALVRQVGHHYDRHFWTCGPDFV